MKINFKLEEDFKKYVFRQIFNYFIISFFVFVLFYFSYGLVLAGLVIWVLFVFFVISLYIDLKLSYQIQDTNKRLDNIEYIIRHIKGK